MIAGCTRYSLIMYPSAVYVYTFTLKMSQQPQPIHFILPTPSQSNIFKVYHDLLLVDEASKWLRNLLGKIHDALEEFHQANFSHYDIRLENICFDTSFNAVLVDVDRYTDIDEGFHGSTQSCMYPGGLPPNCITMYSWAGWQHGCWTPQESTIKGNGMNYHNLSKGKRLHLHLFKKVYTCRISWTQALSSMVNS